MKEKELSVGDWVLYKVGDLCRYERVRNGKYLYVHCDYFLPIPLTEDIILSNGFDKVHNSDDGACEETTDYLTNGFYFTLFHNSNEYCIRGTSIRFSYVHELQHILRLCGKESLADDFKIE